MPIVQRRSSYGSEDPERDYIMPPHYATRRGGRGAADANGRTLLLLLLLVVIVAAGIFYPTLTGYFDSGAASDREAEQQQDGGEARSLAQLPVPPGAGSVLVSYSYFEKDPIQRENAEAFFTLGMGLGNKLGQPHPDTHFVIVVNGKELDDPVLEDLSRAYIGDKVTMLKRVENEGMDFAAHNVTISWLQARGILRRYKYFIFLNSSIRGPFVPTYMPQQWQWTRAYTDRLVGAVHAVSSSLVCLPEVDAGGYGPKLESWAFGVDQAGLGALINETVFALRTCKLCDDGVVVKGEYGLTAAMFKRGYNIDTLMAKYRGVDWHDDRHWRCNNNVHPSRHGTYDGLSMHPFETVFIKASWHVGEPFTETYTKWALAQAAGRDTTGGHFDEKMYRYAISPEAQESHHVGKCYQVLNQPTQWS